MKKHLLENEQELEILKQNYKHILIQFSAHWCGPCRKITPELTEYLSNVDKDDSIYVYCDVDTAGELPDKFLVNSIPCFSTYNCDDGLWTDKLVSSDLEKIKEYCKENGVLKNENAVVKNENAEVKKTVKANLH